VIERICLSLPCNLFGRGCDILLRKRLFLVLRRILFVKLESTTQGSRQNCGRLCVNIYWYSCNRTSLASPVFLNCRIKVNCHNNNCAIEATPTKFTNHSQVQQKIQQNFNEIPVQSICPVPGSFVCPPFAFVMSKATAWTRSQLDLLGNWVCIPTRRVLATRYAIYPGLTRLGTNNAIS